MTGGEAPGHVARSLSRVRARIESACAAGGRAFSEVQIVAVSKGVSIESIREAISAGQRTFGESRAQEALAKTSVIEGAEWHMIGRIQKNKVRHVVQFASVLHSLDSWELAEEIESRASSEVECFVQVNISGERAKAGVGPDEVAKLLARCSGMSRLRITGLTTIPPFSADPESSRPVFRRLRELRDHLATDTGFSGIRQLSMGMSQDYAVAVEEGATAVRIGTAIFGGREE